MGDLEVSIEGMRDSSRRLRRISNGGENAVAAAETVSAGGEAFGYLCSFIGEMLNPLEAAATGSARATMASIDGYATTTKVAADGLETADLVIGEVFDFLKEFVR